MQTTVSKQLWPVVALCDPFLTIICFVLSLSLQLSEFWAQPESTSEKSVQCWLISKMLCEVNQWLRGQWMVESLHQFLDSIEYLCKTFNDLLGPILLVLVEVGAHGNTSRTAFTSNTSRPKLCILFTIICKSSANNDYLSSYSSVSL